MLRRLLSAGLLAAGLILVAPTTPAAAANVIVAPSPETGTVRGVFTDQAGAPIAGASVTSRSPEFDGRTSSATTDARGRYQLNSVPAGPITVSFTHERVTQYAPGKPQAQAGLFTVVPGLTTVIDERKVPTGTVQGRLTTAAGAPVTNGSTSITTPFGQLYLAARTDDDGRYAVAGVPAGPLTISFNANSLTQWGHDAGSAPAATTFTLTAGERLTIDESLLPTGTLTGKINRTTRPVTVYAYQVDGTNFVGGQTAADGTFSLTVPVGRWQVRIASYQWVPGQIDRADAQIFEVRAGRPTRLHDRMRPTGQLRVALRTPGLRLSRWTFGVWHDGELIASTRGTTLGRNYFNTLLPGEYIFGYTSGAGTTFYAPGTVRIENATRVKVRPGKRKQIWAYQPAGGTLTGTVTLPTGEPLPGIKVRADAAVDGVTLGYTATTGPDGTWRMNGVFPETYRLTLTNPTGKLTQDGGLVTTSSGGTATVDTAWQRGGAVTVTAVDAETGAPVTGFCATVIAKSGEYCTPGSTVTAAGLAAGPTLLTLTPRGGDKDHLVTRDVAVTVTDGGNTRVTVPVTLGGRLHLEVHDRATGAPFDSACIVAVEVGTGTGTPGSSCTNRNGKATTAALPVGVYQLFVRGTSSSGSQWYTPEGGTGDQREATKFRVRAGHTIKAGTALLDRAGTVSGVVRDPAGQPVAGVNVGVLAHELPGAARTPLATTDNQGRYTLRDLGPYSWPLLFTPAWDLPRQFSGATGNRFQAETIALTSGATTPYDMALSAGTTVSGTVTVKPGGPAWSGGRLKARNVASGDLLAVVDVPGQGGDYEFTVIGGRPVTIDWHLANPVTKAAGQHEGPVSVPAEGAKRLDLTIG
ncbi:carboxypeptidase regulatory-like domain-containing protein [Actinoplanes sp. NPDC051470]|uniref:carboxypeptidase regulatory-like domain-containing protein n=1 Tax=Actinoplanes sp. NPDC051470 TaxID=3157224 RepID=UPI0034465C70